MAKIGNFNIVAASDGRIISKAKRGRSGALPPVMAAWKKKNQGGINLLMEHFASKGQPYKHEHHLMTDLMDDNLGVWIDSHRKNDVCDD